MKRPRRPERLLFSLILASLLPGALAPARAVEIGVARMDVTPAEPIRLTGYASRKTNSIGVEQRLWAKALAIGSDREGPALLLTLDNCGIAEETYKEVVARLAKKGIKQERLAIACSHTHSGPCTTHWAPNIFAQDIPPDHQATIDRYTRALIGKLEQVALAALKDRRPGKLAWSQGSVEFARNRRIVVGNTAQFGDNAAGPVDHALPILLATDADGKFRAVVANYACHCTTLGGEFNKLCGDWAGYAQEAIERDHPGAVALVAIGCGADSNPFPRGGADGGLAFAKQHAEELAAEVKRLVGRTLAPLPAKLTTKLKHIELPFGPQFTRDEWQQRATNSGIVGYHAKKWLARLDRGEKLPSSLSYYVQTWNFGDDLALVFLSGEVVVDYALRLKKEFDATRLWVNGYANYVPCYIPSRRILGEGGYEAEGSLWYYDRPARISTNAEDLIIKTVHDLMPKSFRADPKKAEFPDPKSPQEALATFRTHADLTVELVVSEPMIESPVAIDWGADGRLWVCEMFDYPTGLDGKFKPGGRIKVLESTKHDGHYDKATLFLDGLAFPTGVMPWRKGALICAAPDILYAEDTDGDGRADLIRTNFTGFATHNYQARVNGFTWGLDGWLHGSSGLFGGKVKSLLTGKEVDLSGRDFRMKPDTGEIEPVAGLSQMGRVRDDFDNWFGNDNSTLLWHYPLPDHYMRRNPYVTYPEPRVNVGANGARPADAAAAKGDAPAAGQQTRAPLHPNVLFPVSRTLERFNSPESANRVTSACSPCIYRDNLLGAEYYGNAFICEPVHDLVRRLVLEPDGVTFAGHRAPSEERSEFLASTDNWFRPVQVRTGQDGALWIVDMYRFVIEHPRWIPPERLKTLDVRAGADKGRIYRVYPKGAKLRRIFNLATLSDLELVRTIGSLNGPARDLAQQELAARDFKFVREVKSATGEPLMHTVPENEPAQTLLRRLVENGVSPAVRVQAMCALVQMDSGFPSYFGGMSDRYPEVRRHAIRLAEREKNWNPVEHWKFLNATNDPDSRVIFQLALSAGELTTFGEPFEPSCKLGLADDPWIQAAVLSSATAQGRPGQIFNALLSSSRPMDIKFVGQLFTTAANSPNSSDWQEMLRAITPAGEKPDQPWQWSALARLLDVLERNRVSTLALSTSTEAESRDAADRIRKSLDRARELAVNTGSDEALREAAIPLLGHGEGDNGEGLATLAGFLQPGVASRLQAAAVDTLRHQRSPRVAELLLKNWGRSSLSFRATSVSILLSRDQWTAGLLKAAEQGVVAPNEIPLASRQLLLKQKNAALRERAEKLFASSRSASRADVLAKYQNLSSFTSAPEHGAELFDKNCAQCHAFRGHGYAVGPNLVEFAGKSLQDFLVAILDPNAAIEPKSVAYNIETKDGRSLTGLVRGETASSLTLVQGGGIEEKILRSDIAEIRASQVSLMPEGVEQILAPQDLADLIAWLKQPVPSTNAAR